MVLPAQTTQASFQRAFQVSRSDLMSLLVLSRTVIPTECYDGCFHKRGTGREACSHSIEPDHTTGRAVVGHVRNWHNCVVRPQPREYARRSGMQGGRHQGVGQFSNTATFVSPSSSGRSHGARRARRGDRLCPRRAHRSLLRWRYRQIWRPLGTGSPLRHPSSGLRLQRQRHRELWRPEREWASVRRATARFRLQ